MKPVDLVNRVIDVMHKPPEHEPRSYKHVGIIVVALDRYLAHLSANAQAVIAEPVSYSDSREHLETIRDLWDMAQAAKRAVVAP